MTHSAAKLNEDDIVEFLEKCLDRKFFHLLSADTKNKGKGAFTGFVAESTPIALEWIERQQRTQRGIYFQWGTPRENQAKKAGKDELRWLHGPHVDMDLPGTIERSSEAAEDWIDAAIDDVMDRSLKLCGGRPHIVMSGNGIQALWPLETPLKATDENKASIEGVNQRIMALFGAPAGTHNCDRVLRVPGTKNFPDAVKRGKGFRPVMAELVYVTQDDFTLDSFARLPEAPAATAKVRSSPNRIDYTKKSYSRDYVPFTYVDLAKDQPELVHACAKRLGEEEARTGVRNRSVAWWIFFLATFDFFTRKLDLPAREMTDDIDVYRNIMELALEAEDFEPVYGEMLDHYFDHKYGLATMGYDLVRALEEAQDSDMRATERGKARADRRGLAAELHETPPERIQADDARKLFIDYVHTAVQARDLPNCKWASAEKTATQQYPTESNIRAILRAAEIELRWDVMRSEARLYVLPEAGIKGRDIGRPELYFSIAMKHTDKDTRSVSELGLLYDALTMYGITSREEAEHTFKLIARQRPFHPIEDYCMARPWDGVRRISQVAACLDTQHPLRDRYMEVFFYSCVAAVKSLRRYGKTGNGEQMSSIITLVGPQGIGKTTFWQRVIPPGMISEGSRLALGTGKETDSKAECLSGLVAILDEIGGSMDRSEDEAFKNFITATSDRFRVAWARIPVVKPRMTVFVGTSNRLHLKDATGSRRFLAMQCDRIDLAALADIDLQQVYAEAWHAVMSGASWWLDREDDATRAQENDDFQVASQEEAALTTYLSCVTHAWQPQWLTATQICRLLDLRYTPFAWSGVRQHMQREDIPFQERLRRKGLPDLRSVWQLPVLPERYRDLVT